MATIKKRQAGGTVRSTGKAPDIKGDWITVQKRNLPPKDVKTSVPKKKMGGKISTAKGGKWIQKATASIKRRGTEGVCTGSKYGGPGCPPGSKRYNLAKTFRKMAKSK